LTDSAEISISFAPIDLDMTLGCGQTFRWGRLDDGAWRGVLGESLMEVRQSGDVLSVKSVPEGASTEAVVRAYLRAQDDLPAIHKQLSKDPVLSKGLKGVRGFRLVKMDEWECIISYVLATYSNIPRIKKMIDSISQTYGLEIAEGVFSFPDIDSLREASVGDLRVCGLGYRAEYVRAICDSLDDLELNRMSRLPYEDLRERLKMFPGIGDKVADCVSLFGFGRTEAFPIDVWVRRAVDRLYGASGSYETLRRFGKERFGAVAGYAQEYLFFNERVPAKAGTCMFSRARPPY
jgi:N-glycosylase/DNA lyase